MGAAATTYPVALFNCINRATRNVPLAVPEHRLYIVLCSPSSPGGCLGATEHLAGALPTSTSLNLGLPGPVSPLEPKVAGWTTLTRRRRPLSFTNHLVAAGRATGHASVAAFLQNLGPNIEQLTALNTLAQHDFSPLVSLPSE